MKASIRGRLSRAGFAVAREGFMEHGRRFRWRVSSVSDPTYAAGFETIAAVEDWLDDREWDNASLPIYRNRRGT